MKALIAIHQQSVNNQPLPTVSARELHRFLEVGRDFSTWIKDRIEEFGYESGRDFLVNTGSPISGSGEFNPCPPKEYHLTLDMAKELAMIERSPMGRVARKYFIKCEQLAREAVPLLLETVFKCKPDWARMLEYRRMGLNNNEIAGILGQHRRTVVRQFTAMRACGVPVPEYQPRKLPRLAVFATDTKQLQLFPVEARA
jgi:phage anti-repressor protein